MERLATALPATVRRLLRQGEMSQGKLDFAWRTAVGPAIGRATTVSLQADGTLEVWAAETAWRRELRHSQAMILRRVQDLLGHQAVTSLKIAGRGRARS